jgi:two-component system LytT family response regulator
MSFSVIIVDDEPNGSESLSLLIKEYCPSLHIVAIASNVPEAVSAIRLHKPQVVFLDIEMPDGSGFEVIDKTTEQNYHVVFTTAYEQYALKAFKLNALDYLLKPVSIEELLEAVKKLERIKDTPPVNWSELLREVNFRSRKQKISIPTQEGLLFIDTENILRLEADSNYTHLFLTTGKKHTASKTLKEFESLLEESLFVRVHSAHLVNLSRIEKYIKGDGGYVVLNDGSSVPVSRSQKAELLSRLGQ